MLGLYLIDGSQIASGAKTAIISPTPKPSLPGHRILIVKDLSAAALTGIVRIGQGLPLDIAGFTASKAQHGIARADRLRWWPHTKQFTIYSVEHYYPFAAPQPFNLPPGIQMDAVPMLQAQITEVVQGAKGYRYTIGIWSQS